MRHRFPRISCVYIFAANIASLGVKLFNKTENRIRSPLYFKLERTGENRFIKKSLIGQVPHAKSCERRFQVFMRNKGLQNLLNRGNLSLKNNIHYVKKTKQKILDTEN